MIDRFISLVKQMRKLHGLDRPADAREMADEKDLPDISGLVRIIKQDS
jgi:hypothetical protein